MSPDNDRPAAITATAEPDALTDLRAAFAERIGKEDAAPESASPEATAPASERPASGVTAVPAEGEPPQVQEADDDEAQDAPEDDGTPAADPLAGLSRKQRGALLKTAEENLARERTAREQAEARVREIETANRAGEETFRTLTGTDEQLADLKRRARAGDTSARDQADIYEANRELLAPISAHLKAQSLQDAHLEAWHTVGVHFHQLAEHLPKEKRDGFLNAPNVKAGGDYLVSEVTAPLKAEIKTLKDELKAIKAERDGLRAQTGSRGAAPVSGGRSASSATIDPNASSLDDIRSGLAKRLQPA